MLYYIIVYAISIILSGGCSNTYVHINTIFMLMLSLEQPVKMAIINFLITVAPDAIHHHIKTCRTNMKNMHFVAPEYGSKYEYMNHI